MRSKNHRRHHRTTCGMPVVVAWTDDRGSDRFTNGKCVEVSATGLRVELSQPIPLHSYVTLRLEGIDVTASARVRHVRQRGLMVVIGLELREPLRTAVLNAFSQLPNPSAA